MINLCRFKNVLISFRWLLFPVLLINGMSMSYAGAEVCSKDNIYNSLSAYLTQKNEGHYLVSEQDLANIQVKLEEKGYGPVGEIGLNGPLTRKALARFCDDQKNLSFKGNMLTKLVALLNTPQEQVLIEKSADEKAHFTISNQPEPPAISEINSAVDFSATAKISINTDAVPLSSSSFYYSWTDTLDEKHENVEQQTKLTSIIGIEYPNELIFDSALSALGIDEGIYKEIKERSLVEPPPPLNNLNVSGGDCGCSRQLSNIIYGFYPYWLGENDTVQILDYSYYDRIAYYSVELNENGDVDDSKQWDNKWNASGFIHEAHTHYVDVDITLYATGWQAWSNALIGKASRNTAQLVQKTFKDSEGGSARNGDGVTLVFEGFGLASLESKEKLITYVNAISKQLESGKISYKINLLLDIDINQVAQINSTIFSDIKSLLLIREENPAIVENVFVFLQQPTSDLKKKLRRIIENEFKGHERVKVLRKIVPILSPYGDANDVKGKHAQFEDDLIYLKENFAGVALWPVLLDSDEALKDDLQFIKDKISTVFEPVQSNDHLGDFVEKQLPFLCQFVCPNRWEVRFVFNFMISLLLIYAMSSVFIFSIRKLFHDYTLYFIVVIVCSLMLGFSLLLCDPYWQERANEVIFALTFTVIILVLMRYIMKISRPPLP